jgi:ketosteroid isomerase-like protein
MKTLNLLIIVMIFISLSCTQETVLSEEDKKAVETEIHEFMASLEAVMESPSPDEYYNYFLHTDELAVASQGQLFTNPAVVRDTINKHLGMMEKQSIKTNAEKIYVINKKAVVLSAAKVTTITFKNGAQITMPYAWTLLIVKRDGKWKIAHAHN